MFTLKNYLFSRVTASNLREMSLDLELASVIISCLIRRDSSYTCFLEEKYILLIIIQYAKFIYDKKKQYFYLMEFELIFSFF